MPSALLEDLVLRGSKKAIPAFIYGTAWKKELTADLVYQAISAAGVRAIDTAAQPKHYREDLVGAGIRRALGEGRVRREELYIQTKYTPLQGQDPSNLPYDPSASITEQVHASVASSLHNLRTTTTKTTTKTTTNPSITQSSSDKKDENDDYIDCLVLHSPLPTQALTLEAWSAASSYVPHKIRALGISNVYSPAAAFASMIADTGTISSLLPTTPAPISVLQNRFHAHTNYDTTLRALCNKHGIVYQAFWTLTANPPLINNLNAVSELVRVAGLGSREEAFYCLVLSLPGVAVLNGSCDLGHLRGDLEAVGKVRAWVERCPEEWARIQRGFVEAIGDGRKGS